MNIDLETPPYFRPASDAGTTELQTMEAFELPPPNFESPEQSQTEHALDTKAHAVVEGRGLGQDFGQDFGQSLGQGLVQ